jgi:hypothetical protein
MKYFATFLSLLMFVLCGCSKPTHPSAEFSQRISEADHVVVTNRYLAFGSTISGAEIGSLAKAVASAQRMTLGADTDCDWDADFFSGTNRVAVIHLHDSVIMLDGIQYRDGSGVMTHFWQELLAKRSK